MASMVWTPINFGNVNSTKKLVHLVHWAIPNQIAWGTRMPHTCSVTSFLFEDRSSIGFGRCECIPELSVGEADSHAEGWFRAIIRMLVWHLDFGLPHSLPWGAPGRVKNLFRAKMFWISEYRATSALVWVLPRGVSSLPSSHSFWVFESCK